MAKPGMLLAFALLGIVFTVSTAFAHPSRPSPERGAACEDKSLGDLCRYEDKHHIYRGTCRLVGESLTCIRNQPIIERDHPRDGE